MITQLANPRIHQIMSRAIVEITVGEMEQIRYFFSAGQSIRDYLLRIKRKTALLIAISCQLGAIASDADEEAIRRLYRFGYNVGMAFQIRDDILDLCGTEKQLGKPPGSDIRQGNITLPVIYALQDPKRRSELLGELAVIQERDGQTDVNRFIQLVRESDGIRRSDELASRYIQKAIDSLHTLPDIQAKRDLVEVAHFVGSRSY